MGLSKPIAGHPSRTHAVMSLRAQGLTTREIAERLGIADLGQVRALEASGRRTAKLAHLSTGPSILPPDVAQILRPHAERRGLTVVDLARQILESVAEENMVDAVMDDMEPPVLEITETAHG